MVKLKKRKADSPVSSQKATWVIDDDMISSMKKYVISDVVTPTNLANLAKFINSLDMETFRYTQDQGTSMQLIKGIATARSEKALKDRGAIKSYVSDNYPESNEILSDFNWDPHQIEKSDARQITKSINEKLQYYLLMSSKDEIDDLFVKLQNSKFYSLEEYTTRLRKCLSKVLTEMQNTDISNGLIRDFSFSADNMEELIDKIVEKAHRPTAILQTGIRQLNAILAPGFASSRLYVFLGLTGGFKSGTLLNIADQIRLFNPQVNPVVDGRRRTILFVTMENSVEETIGRLYDMYSDEMSDMATTTAGDVIRALRENGKYKFSDSTGIDIDFVYRANLSIATSDLYNIIQGLEDSGKEVISVVLDYIKRIDSPKDCYGDERIRLSYVAQELKSLAQYFEIPVITAQQVNREGNSIIDAAIREGKEDVLRFVGSANIGSAWAIAEEADWIGMLNRETQKSTGRLFLSVKRVKLRGKEDPSKIDYFNHPFTNSKNIRLETDVDKPFSVSVRTLATDLESSPTTDPFETEHRPNVDMTKSPSEKSRAVMQIVGLSNLVKAA